MICSLGLLAMRSLNASNGAAAYWTTSAPSIVRTRSGMLALATDSGATLQRGEERADFAPHFGAAGKPAPVGADQSDQLVTFIYRDQIIFRGDGTAVVPDAVDEQRGHVRLHRFQDGIGLLDIHPGFQREQRFRRDGGTGVKRDHFSVRRAVEEECHFNGDHQSVPLGVGQLKIREELHAARNSFVFRAALPIEKNRAGLAGADQFAAGGLDEVFVLGKKLAAAHFAALDGRALARKLAKGCERAFLQRWKRRSHISHRSAGRARRTRRQCPGHLRVARGRQIQNATLRYRLLAPGSRQHPALRPVWPLGAWISPSPPWNRNRRA